MGRFIRWAMLVAALAFPMGAAAQDLLLLKAGSGASAAAGMTFTYGSAGDNSAQTTYTFASQAVGAASANRVIIVAVGSEQTSNETVTGVTIGGVSATKDVGEPATGLHSLELWSAVVPTGTSITITFTMSSTATARGAIAWVSILGSTQATHFAVANATTQNGSGPTFTTSSLSIPTNGFGFAAVRYQNAAGAPFTWSQSSGTGLKQADINGGVNLSMGTYSTSFTASGSTTFSATNSPAGSANTHMAALSWSP